LVATTYPPEHIESATLLLRGHKVLLDADLAALYGVMTQRLNEQVRPNQSRFPEDFMFRLISEEAVFLRSQFARPVDLATEHTIRKFSEA